MNQIEHFAILSMGAARHKVEENRLSGIPINSKDKKFSIVSLVMFL